MRARTWLLVGIAVAAVLLLVGRAVSTLVVDHAWYVAMGAPSVWWERFTDTLLLQGGAWIAGSLFAFANLHSVRRTILAVAVPSRVANIEMTAMIPGQRLLWITILLAALLGLALAAPLTDWTTVALARHGIPFGEIEGFLDRDLGFYVYWLPLEETLYIWALVSTVSLTAVVLVLYALTRSLRLDGRRVVASTHVRRHLSVLGALVLLLLAWSYRLDAFDMLREGSGRDGLFLRVDHIVTLKVDLLLSIMSGVAALLILRAGWFGQLRMAFITLSLVLVAALGLRHTLPSLVASGNWLGDPARRDNDYLTTRTLVSRRAYDVDGIRYVASDSLGKVAAPRGARVPPAELAHAVGLWGAEAVRLRLTESNRSPRGSAPLGWYADENGVLRALFARRVTPGAEEWSLRSVDVTQPMLRDSVIDLHEPSSDDVQSARDQEPVVAPEYTGHRVIRDSSGAVLGTALRSRTTRLAHAWATRDPSLLNDDSLAGPSARFLSHRDVRERVELLAPVLAQGEDLTPIFHDGVLYWALDLYSASDSYPLSQRWNIAGEVRSYFHHAATALVEAATGRVRFVTVERPDPLARTWMALAPTLFVKPSALPPGLADMLPPPTDGAIAQTRALAVYGSRTEGAVQRFVTDSAFVGEGPTPHVVTTDSGRVLGWSAPLLDAGEQFGGVVTVVGGRRRITIFDTSTAPRARWSSLTERVRVALDSARAALPEGSRRDPRARAGRLQVVMSTDGPALFQPLQWNRGDGSIVISRVAALTGTRVGVGMSVAEALLRSSGAGAGRLPMQADPALAEPRDVSVARLYDVMRQAMKRGDWTRFGQAFDSLGQALGKPPS